MISTKSRLPMIFWILISVIFYLFCCLALFLFCLSNGRRTSRCIKLSGHSTLFLTPLSISVVAVDTQQFCCLESKVSYSVLRRWEIQYQWPSVRSQMRCPVSYGFCTISVALLWRLQSHLFQPSSPLCAFRRLQQKGIVHPDSKGSSSLQRKSVEI